MKVFHQIAFLQFFPYISIQVVSYLNLRQSNDILQFHLLQDGKSVMVEVATGGNTGEQLPMVLKVPHLSGNPDLKACGVPYSMLGFGDILVPGLLLSYCHSFDLYVGTSYKLYWLLTNVGKFLSKD